jgi:hypothetical protein
VAAGHHGISVDAGQLTDGLPHGDQKRLLRDHGKPTNLAAFATVTTSAAISSRSPTGHRAPHRELLHPA